MSIIRVKKDKNNPYKIFNTSSADDQELSMKAKGLMFHCLAKPDHWQFHVSQLVTVLKEGKDAIYATIQELLDVGYCLKIQKRTKGGQFQQYDYVIHEEKIKKRVPQRGFPEAENPTLVNIYCSDNIKTTTIPPPCDPIPESPDLVGGGSSKEEIYPFLKNVAITHADKIRFTAMFEKTLAKQVIDYVTSPNFKFTTALDSAMFHYAKNPGHMKETPKIVERKKHVETIDKEELEFKNRDLYTQKFQPSIWQQLENKTDVRYFYSHVEFHFQENDDLKLPFTNSDFEQICKESCLRLGIKL